MYLVKQSFYLHTDILKDLNYKSYHMYNIFVLLESWFFIFFSDCIFHWFYFALTIFFSVLCHLNSNYNLNRWSISVRDPHEDFPYHMHCSELLSYIMIWCLWFFRCRSKWASPCSLSWQMGPLNTFVSLKFRVVTLKNSKRFKRLWLHAHLYQIQKWKKKSKKEEEKV